MTDEEKLNKFVQQVYMTRYNRYIDDIEDEDGQVEVEKTIDWTNLFLDELETETDWHYVRKDGETLGTIVTAAQTFELDDEIRKLVTSTYRPLLLKQGDSIVSRFEVVDANQITRNTSFPDADRVTKVGNKLIFSRAFKDYEIGATVVADTVHYIPRLATDDIEVLDLVKPYSLLVLGVAKNATLPDIVQGGLSPSFVQKYGDLLEKAIAENEATTVADEAIRDDYSHIGGVF